MIRLWNVVVITEVASFSMNDLRNIPILDKND